MNTEALEKAVDVLSEKEFCGTLEVSHDSMEAASQEGQGND